MTSIKLDIEKFFLDLPNVHERLAIIKYHLRDVAKHGYLSSNVSASRLEQLSMMTNNYNAADVAGIVREAIAEAFDRTNNVSA